MLLENCPPGAETLITRMLHILTEKSIFIEQKYSIISLVEHQGTLEICSSYPEFVLTGVPTVFY